MGTRARSKNGGIVVLAVAIALLVGVLGAILVLSGGGGGDATGDAAAVIERSFRRTTQRSTLRYETTLTVDRPDAPTRLTVAAATDATASSARGTVAMGDDEQILEFLVQGRRLFLQRTDVEPRAVWTEVDLLATLDTVDDPEIGLLGLALQRPVEFLSMLRGVQSADDHGREDVDGVRSTRYGAVVSFDAAISIANRMTDVELLRSVAQRIDGDELAVQAWIDDNGKLRKLTLAGTLDGGAGYELELRIESFGDEVRADLPPDTTLVTPLDLRQLLQA